MPSDLRVLYSFPHPLGGPGINTTAWQQVAGIAKAGADVTVYCTSLRTSLPDSVRVVETMVVGGHRIPHRAVGLRRAYDYHDWRVAKAVERHHRDFDLVHSWPRSCLRTADAARGQGLLTFREAPNAHTATTFAESERATASIGIELPRGASHRFDRRRLREEEQEFDRVDYLLVPSDYVERSFLDQGVPARKLVRHQYGFDPRAFPAPGDRGDRPFTAVFVGRGEPPKGLHLALDAWAASGLTRSGRFLIAGSLDPAYGRYLAPLLADPSVERLGFVDDVGSLLGRADVLVLPSFTEGSALVVMEAMACGTVPLVSLASGAPIRPGTDGLVHEVGEVATLAGQLRDLAGDPDRLARLSDATAKSSRALTWESAAQSLLRAYHAGLDRPTTAVAETAVGDGHDNGGRRS